MQRDPTFGVGDVVWHFFRKDPKSKAREAIQGEFFNNEDIRDASVALIREAFQNSLDQNVDQKIRIRLTVSEMEQALDHEVANKYFRGFWKHMFASAPEFLRDSKELEKSKCPYVVIEDFGTTGLTGNEFADLEPADRKNNFYYFFRAEGRSGKSGNDKGRWGIGKYVFPKSSAINAFFALTIRDGVGNPGPLLMGQAVLRNHSISSEGTFEPDGWYAIDGSTVYEPISDCDVIEEFCRDWKVTRTSEPGLSIVIPYVAEMNSAEVFRSVIEEYMLVILQGQLEVELCGPNDDELVLTKENLRVETERIFKGNPGLNNALRDIDLLTWALAAGNSEAVVLAEVTGSPEWTASSISEDQGTAVRGYLESVGRVIIRVPVTITQRDAVSGRAAEQSSHFEVVYWRDDANVTPMFIRQGIKISSVRSKSSNGIRAVVIIRDGVLASLLGDAEGPAHADWEYRTLREKYRGRYTYAENWITFVKRAPKRIIDIAQGADREGDRSIAASWFPDLTEGRGDGDGGVGGANTSATTATPPPSPPPPRPRKVLVDQVPGGFKVHLTKHGKDVTHVEVKVAYAIRRGDPFRKWCLDDFDPKTLKVEVHHGRLDAIQENRWIFEVTDPSEFWSSVIGLDEHRDVVTTTRFAP